MSFCIVYLASPRTSQIKETVGNDSSHPTRISLLWGSYNIVRKTFPTTDVYIFHEDYTEEEFALFPDVTDFVRVDFSGFEDVYSSSNRRPRGYLMMCRFFSGVMQAHPQLRKYSHYMRLDDDSYFTSPELTESFVKANLLNHDYVYRSLFYDERDQQSLYQFTMDFVKTVGFGQYVGKLQTFLRSRRFLRDDNTYTGLAPYNNFHIASQRLWQTPLVAQYIQAIESSAGIFKYGWMDANIHAMIVFVLAPLCGLFIHHEASFGYRHNQHVSRLHTDAVEYNPNLPFGV
jgi:hypothetical protein